MDEVVRLLEEMREKGLEGGVFVYGSLIIGFCRKGCFDRGKEVFEEMAQRGVTPNVVTFNCLANGLSKMGEYSL